MFRQKVHRQSRLPRTNNNCCIPQEADPTTFFTPDLQMRFLTTNDDTQINDKDWGVDSRGLKLRMKSDSYRVLYRW